MAPASAIILLAATSRSMVVAPSTAISFSFCKICQTSRPLRRIFSNSAAVLRTIIGFYRLANFLIHQLRWIVTGIHFDYAPSRRAKILGHRAGLPLIRIQPLPNHGLAIVVPDHQSLAIQVAQLIHLRRMESDVVQGPAARALAASGQTGNNYIVINREMNHHLTDAAPIQPGAEAFGLRPRARVSVQHKTLGGVSLAEPLLYHLIHYPVRNQSPGLHGGGHSRGHFRSHPGLLPDAPPQHVSGGDVGDSQTLGQQLGLGTFSGSRRAKQDDRSEEHTSELQSLTNL